MKDKLIRIDQLLGNLEVKGDSVFILVEIRKLIKELYDKELQNETTVPKQCE